MRISLVIAALVAGMAALSGPMTASAQQDIWTGGTSGNWTDGTWTFFGPPLPSDDLEGVVGSTVGSGSPTAVVNVTSDIRSSYPSSSVILGDGGGTDGTLNISSSGALAVVNQGISLGFFDVGRNGGLGKLNVASGGILEVDAALNSTTGSSGSTISLQGTASVSAASATLDRNLVIQGSNVNFSVASNLVLGLAGTHSWVIPASGASTISVGGNADLGGTLKVTFPDGAPTVGATWNLVDAASVDANEAIPSGFGFVDTSAVSGLSPGARFSTRTVVDAGSDNGVYGQLVLEQHPILVVDRNTNTMTLRNPGGVTSIAFDTYAITSAMGALNSANWNSLSPSNGWVESNPSANTLSELNPTGSGTVAANTSINLGQVFNRPTPTSFGQENEDIRFRYAKPDGGFIEGEVVYTGLPNNTLTLQVDPDTGEAQLVNGTAFTVSIDNYNIFSAAGLLKFANGSPANTWNSLQDQGADGGLWFEANQSANQLSELLVAGGLQLSPNETVSLGSPFDETDGRRDLSFTFALLESSDGDFNGDGVVNLADYTVWRDNLGASESGGALHGNGNGGIVDASDYTLWKSNFGNTNGGGTPTLLTGKVVYSSISPGALASLASPVAVPEPSAALLATVAAVGWMTWSTRKSHH